MALTEEDCSHEHTYPVYREKRYPTRTWVKDGERCEYCGQLMTPPEDRADVHKLHGQPSDWVGQRFVRLDDELEATVTKFEQLHVHLKTDDAEELRVHMGTFRLTWQYVDDYDPERWEEE